MLLQDPHFAKDRQKKDNHNMSKYYFLILFTYLPYHLLILL